MNYFLTLRELQAALSHLKKNKKSLGADAVTKKC